jgi:hypothetical protein
MSGVRSSVGEAYSNVVAFGQGVASVTFDESVGVGISSVGAFVTVVDIVVAPDVVASVDGAAVVVDARGVVVWTVADVVGRAVCVAAFATAVEVISADRPATVGTVDSVAADEEVLTIGDVPAVAADETAGTTQRQRARTARRRADCMNGFTVHLPWGRRGAAVRVPSRLS